MSRLLSTVPASLTVSKGDFNALVAMRQQCMDAKDIPFDARNGMLARRAPMQREIISQD